MTSAPAAADPGPTSLAKALVVPRRHILTPQDLIAIGGPKAKLAVVEGIVDNLAWLDKFGISKPVRLVHFLAQTGEESDHFATLTEYASGDAYEGRGDLGNVKPGDGPRFKGRGNIELTGRTNYRAFTAWLRSTVPSAPDFEALPNLLAVYPWAIYAAVWYWASHNLNTLADRDDVDTITHKVNGGFNGLGERIVMLGRASLVLLGFDPRDVKGYQRSKGLNDDGIIGALTRASLHADLAAIDLVPGAVDAAGNMPPEVPPAIEAPAAVRLPPPVLPSSPAAGLPALPAPSALPAVKSRGFWASIFHWLFERNA